MSYELNSEILRKVQLIQLEILNEFDRICKLNNLKYQLFAGTLLGAIRHKGFIPWDDDIDVAMVRSEYERFLEVCNDYINPDYFLQNYNTDPKFFHQFARLRKNNTKYIQQSYKDIDMHHGIFIDIFPLDNVIPDSIIEKIRCKILLVLFRLNKIRNRGVSTTWDPFKRTLEYILRVSNQIIPKQIFDLGLSKIIRLFEHKDTGYLNHLTNGVTQVRFKRYLMTKEEFENMTEWEFEGRSFPIPTNYHEILTRIYGDYMQLPPKAEQAPHHGIIEVEINED